MLLPVIDTYSLPPLQALDDPRAACLCQPLCYRQAVSLPSRQPCTTSACCQSCAVTVRSAGQGSGPGNHSGVCCPSLPCQLLLLGLQA